MMAPTTSSRSFCQQKYTRSKLIRKHSKNSCCHSYHIDSKDIYHHILTKMDGTHLNRNLQQLPLPLGDQNSHLIHGSFSQPKPTSQMASQSVQPFLHSSWQCPYTLQWAVRLPIKIAPSNRCTSQ